MEISHAYGMRSQPLFMQGFSCFACWIKPPFFGYQHVCTADYDSQQDNLGFTHVCHLFSLSPFLVVNVAGIIISQEIEMIAKSAAYNLIHIG
jgi:hypothetical protein